MLKITFNYPQKLMCYDTISYVLTKVWFGWKTYSNGTTTVLFSECGKYCQSVCETSIKSIEHVKPTDL